VKFTYLQDIIKYSMFKYSMAAILKYDTESQLLHQHYSK